MPSYSSLQSCDARFKKPEGYRGKAQAIALSPDGRLLALPSVVIDTELGMLHSKIAPDHVNFYDDEKVLSLRFINSGKQLFQASVVLGERWEGPADTSHLLFAVWDTSTHQLKTLKTPSDFSFVGNTAFMHNLTADHEYQYVRQIQKRDAKIALDNEPKVEIATSALYACASTAKALHALSPWQVDMVTIDPFKRWIAVAGFLGRDGRGSGFVQELKVYALDSGRLLDQAVFKRAVRGMSASADGERIYALTAPEDFHLRDQEGGYAMYLANSSNSSKTMDLGGEVFELKIETSSLPKRSAATVVDGTTDCLIEDEKPLARQISISDQPAKLLWQAQLDTGDEKIPSVQNINLPGTHTR